MFVKSDLVEKFNWPEMMPREVQFRLRNAETSTPIHFSCMFRFNPAILFKVIIMITLKNICIASVNAVYFC